MEYFIHQFLLQKRYVCILMGLVRQVTETHLLNLLSQNYDIYIPTLVSAIMTFIEKPVFKQDWAQMTLLLNK